MKVWAAILIVSAAVDVLTTYLSLSLGSIEANPLFSSMDIRMTAVIKILMSGLAAYLFVRLKWKAFLIFFSGANVAMVAGNLMAIWTLKTM